ncbi:GerMN domain-containing protein [Paenibacillus protaetiae]|uniref:GerMN domain-containing protein n=1 Tax=Paenibacillus protaetiae TaxID=2509456 RepID=A0A4P6F408_9BACL|nr:GerMN domain-containing protein [Paenibacillus protaetiae]QAY65128.1 hypothetical protein ET464_00720 [Paenibacillus protaetiae]
MNQTRWIRRAAISGVLAIPLLTAGCGLFSQETSSIDPPQGVLAEEEGLSDAPTISTVLDDADDMQGDLSQITVYLQDGNGYLAPVSIASKLDKSEAAGQRALELLVDGGTYSSQIPDGFRAMLPQGTVINQFKVDAEKKLAQVDLSQQFVSYNPQDERPMVEAITWTLTAIPGIEKVELSVDGQRLTEMPEEGYPLDQDLTRAIGINLETGNGVSISQSTPVTLYFSSTTADNEQYYVPVTRLISSTSTPAQAAIEELIAGPLDGDQLTAVVTPDYQVKSVETKDDIVTVDLEDSSYEAGQPVPEELLLAVILSATENTGASQVQIRLNGDTNIVDEFNNSYSEPVSRPHHVNAIKA